MVDFVKELTACQIEGKHFPFRPDLVQGYTDVEIDLIAEKCNLDIHGQFRALLSQMGKCSGGLLWGYDIYMYHPTWDPKKVSDNQRAIKDEWGGLCKQIKEYWTQSKKKSLI